MKLINPFNRKEKRDFIPLSLFPANKMTRTSMQIGRFVPLYVAEMRKNNRIQLSHDQLTRFASMRAPVMQNFDMEFGAYFVPYVALDKFFDSSWFRESIINGNLGSYTQYMLRARDFFNPATNDSLRRHPAHIFRASYGPEFIGVGSLFDHLQMPLYLEELESNFSGSIGGEDFSGESFDTILGYWKDPVGLVTSDQENLSYTVGSTDINILLFSQYVYYRMYCVAGLTFPSDLSYSAVGIQQDLLLHDDLSATGYCTDIVDYILGNPSDPARARARYDEYFFGTRPYDLVEDYKAVIMNKVASVVYAARKDSNLTAWLCYLCIYGHYCLNELFISHEEWNDMIGCAYLVLAAEGANNAPSNTPVTLVDAFTAGNLNSNKNPKLNANPWLEFYANYLKRCECLPVLWNKDQFTASQYQETTSATPIGSTITENFYNRMYARFKDLIARMGGDYKKNVDALLGGSVPDSSLNYPQIVRKDNFTIQVGDIAQTSASQIDSFLGEFAGYAVSRDHSGSYDWTAEEDGMFMVCCWCRPKNVAIANAIPRHNLKSSFFDYLLPQFGGVGYQDIPYSQIFPADANPSQKFAIQERYFEYMDILNECSGLMRTRLKHYHCDRILESAPDPLGNVNTGGIDFLYITDKDNCNRIFNDQFSDPIIMAALFKGTITRQLPAKIQTEF